MKLALAAALGGFQSLSHDETRERPVDRIAAAGAAQIERSYEAQRQAELCSLGFDLIRAKLSGIESAALDATDKLTAILDWPKLKLKMGPRRRELVAAWAIQEWIQDHCKTCRGAGAVKLSKDASGWQPTIECAVCEGSGKRHYEDGERQQFLGGAFDRALYEAHGLIGSAEGLAVGLGKRLLEYGEVHRLDTAIPLCDKAP